MLACKDDFIPKGNPPAFGKPMKKLFWLDEEYVNLNNGSFGSCPRAVIEAFFHYVRISERRPDHFLRELYHKDLNENRIRLAKDYLNCHPDHVAIVANATTAVNAIVQSIPWRKGDKVLYYSTIYGACEKIFFLVADNYGVELIKIDAPYPIEDDELIAITEQKLQRISADGGKVRLSLIDTITSNPGVIVPWERLTRLFQQHDVMVLVDGAHSIGQLPVDIDRVKPDFFISNLHKWAFAHRGCAVLYAPPENHKYAHSLPISHGYMSLDKTRKAACPLKIEAPNQFVEEWSWTGTIELGAFLSVGIALDFRQWIGGETKINHYCHHLAVKGGERMAAILGTSVLEAKDSSYIANMVNVYLPLPRQPLREGSTEEQSAVGCRWLGTIMDSLLNEFNMCLVVFRHNGHWMVRASAQVFNDLDDFEKAGQALLQICKRPEFAQIDTVDKVTSRLSKRLSILDRAEMDEGASGI